MQSQTDKTGFSPQPDVPPDINPHTHETGTKVSPRYQIFMNYLGQLAPSKGTPTRETY